MQLGGYQDEQGDYELEWLLEGNAPANNGFGLARAIEEYEGQFIGTTAGAGHDIGEPDHGALSTAHSVWFAWTAPVGGDVEFSLTDATYDAVVGVYTGTAVGSLTPIGTSETSVPVVVQAGVTYLVVVDGANGESGSFSLTWTGEADPPPNDDFADAEVLTGASGSVSGTNLGATLEVDEPTHAGEDGGRSVWYEWTPAESGPVRIDTFGSSIDTLLAVYVGACAGRHDRDRRQRPVRRRPEPGPAQRGGGDPLRDRGRRLPGRGGRDRAVLGADRRRVLRRVTQPPVLPRDRWMDDTGLSTGYADGIFRPAAPVTRQAMSAFLYRLAGEPPLPPAGGALFTDVVAGHPFFDAIHFMVLSGITEGYDDGTFRPGAVVTRQAMSAFLFRFSGDTVFEPPESATFDDVGTGHPFFLEIEWMADTGISTGYADGTFRPSDVVTRQAMSAFLFRFDTFGCGCP